MPTVIVLSGLPGAGKSSRARQIIAEARRAAGRPGTAGVVSRDTIREHILGLTMAPGDQVLDRDGEDVVTAVTEAQARALLAAGVSVVVDATNLVPAHVDRWRAIADGHDAALDVVTLDTPVEECIRRDEARHAAGGRYVGEDVIRRIAAAGAPTYETT